MFSLLLTLVFCGFILFSRHNNTSTGVQVNFWKLFDDFYNASEHFPQKIT
jgi:hypothetical protein